jgi:pimeloyl-ACP methyl ester carboxylesterase
MSAGAWILVIMLAVAALIGGLMWSTGRTARRAEAAVPRAGWTQRVRNGEIHWVEQGEGPPILMLHGLAGQLQHWTYGVTDLLADDFRCIAVDRPGCGYSEREADAHAHLREQARMIAEFMDAQGIGPALVAGHSLGGALALTLALEHPEKVRGLALVAPLTHPMKEAPAAFRALQISSPAMRRAIGRTVAVPMAARTAERTLAMAFAPEPAPADFVTRGGGALGLRPKAFVTASADLGAADAGVTALAERYEQLEVPGGILYGDADAILSWRAQGEALAKRAPHFEWQLLPGRGHMLPITAPRETADFIRRVARAAGMA